MTGTRDVEATVRSAGAGRGCYASSGLFSPLDAHLCILCTLSCSLLYCCPNLTANPSRSTPPNFISRTPQLPLLRPPSISRLSFLSFLDLIMQPAPPPPHPAPFSPPSSSSASQNGGPGPRAQNRLSGEFRTTTTTTAAPTTTSRPPLPVPSSSSSSSATPTGQNGNGHSRNLSGFDMAARSPPNQSSKDSPFSVLLGFYQRNFASG